MSEGERPLRWRVGLAVQLDVLVVAVVLAMGAVLGALFVRAETQSMEAALAARIRMVGAYVATSAEVAWERDDAGELDALLTRIVLDPDVAYVLLKTREGEVRAARWAGGTRGGVREFLFPLHARPSSGDAPAEPFGQAHRPELPVVGEVAIGVDLAPLGAQRAEVVWRTVTALVLAAGLAATLGHLLVTLLTRTALSRLLAGIRALAAGDLGYRMRLDVRTAELVEIARAFDDMADRLSATLVTKAALEETVSARTRELTRALAEGEQAREALAEREERVRLLLDATAEAICGVDLEGRCTFVNAASVRLLGHAPERLAGSDLHALIHHARTDGTPLEACDCPVIRAVRDGRPHHAESLTYWRADGSPVDVETWSYPVRREGRLIGAMITFLDVTERRRLEGELLNMKKLESLGVLAGGIAHDFNNMLTGILGNLSVALEALPAGSELRELLGEAEHAARRARALTQQLLTFSKGGAPVKKVLSPRAVVEDAATFALRGAPVRGQFSFAPGTWSVEADPGQLAQVIQNLVINAVQAMPGGGTIALSCDNAELGDGGPAPLPLPPGAYVRISVRDEGGGIAREHLSRIFDPYFTTKRTGSGLGLATVYAIVKKHGGHVSVTSRVGAGTTFDVWLPATGRPAQDAPARAGEAVHGRGRVLVLDDEELVRHTAGGMLATLGYEVLSAADGAEAIRLYERERAAGRPVAAVLMDLTIPGGMGGREALERLRAIDPAVRAVATSGYSTDPVMSAHARYGFVGVLPKPYTLDDLARAMADAILPPDREKSSRTVGPPDGPSHV